MDFTVSAPTVRVTDMCTHKPHTLKRPGAIQLATHTEVLSVARKLLRVEVPLISVCCLTHGELDHTVVLRL